MMTEEEERASIAAMTRESVLEDWATFIKEFQTSRFHDEFKAKVHELFPEINELITDIRRAYEAGQPLPSLDDQPNAVVLYVWIGLTKGLSAADVRLEFFKKIHATYMTRVIKAFSEDTLLRIFKPSSQKAP